MFTMMPKESGWSRMTVSHPGSGKPAPGTKGEWMGLTASLRSSVSSDCPENPERPDETLCGTDRLLLLWEAGEPTYAHRLHPTNR